MQIGIDEFSGVIWNMMKQIYQDVRPSPIAGQWYPANPQRLAEMLDSLLDSADTPDIAGKVIGLIAPHAGYRYSGPIAACAFRLVRGHTFERVIIVSPMHRLHPAPVLTSSHDAYQTPLGTIPVDHDVLDELNRHTPITPVRRDAEHSLEIEIPFLQRTLSGTFSLVPLMLRDQSYETAELLGRSLVEIIGQSSNTLLVASSDLSHFYSQAVARGLDQAILDQIAAFDPAGVIRIEDEGKGFACGRAAIATVLVAARALGANEAHIVGYGTSGDITGDTSQVVGYGAAVITQNP
jgi:AmmeMemoRadiSam system protein B